MLQLLGSHQHRPVPPRLQIASTFLGSPAPSGPALSAFTQPSDLPCKRDVKSFACAILCLLVVALHQNWHYDEGGCITGRKGDTHTWSSMAITGTFSLARRSSLRRTLVFSSSISFSIYFSSSRSKPSLSLSSGLSACRSRILPFGKTFHSQEYSPWHDTPHCFAPSASKCTSAGCGLPSRFFSSGVSAHTSIMLLALNTSPISGRPH